jgi:hypothetical protein
MGRSRPRARRLTLRVGLLLWLAGVWAAMAWAEAPAPPAAEPAADGWRFRTLTPPSDWHYGGFVDLGYLLDVNFPQNHKWRGRSTTPRVNELDVNMAAVYVKKDATDSSRWGLELMPQGGQDSKSFGFGTNLPNLPGSSWLRQFGRANVSYLAPVGTGLTVQAGIFNSFIGYESLFAKDNFNYTRAWIADYSPYLQMGVNAQYTFNERWAAALFIVNEYFHLQYANNMPSYGGQVAYKPSGSWTIKETLYYGPDQSNTSLEFWRIFSDSIVEWKAETVTIAADYQVGTQRAAGIPGGPRQFYTGASVQGRWHVGGPWYLGLRPEFYWDRNGLMTGNQQFIKAITATTDYKLPYRWTDTWLRLEYRYDDSTGPGGGFFKGGEVAPGVIGLTPGQQMIIFALIWTMDSP